MYRKPTYSGLYLKWESFVPRQYKRGLVNCLVHRAWQICSTYENFHREVEFIKSVLIANGYPENFISSSVHKYLSKKYQTKQQVNPVYGPDKKSVIVCLPFLGDHSIIIQRQLRRVVNKVTPWINLSVVLTPAFKLTTLSKLKCQVPVLSLSNVVYRINCNVCDQFYIG